MKHTTISGFVYGAITLGLYAFWALMVYVLYPRWISEWWLALPAAWLVCVVIGLTITTKLGRRL